MQRRVKAPQLVASSFSLDRFLGLTGHVGDQLPACQMILDVTGDLFTHGRQLKQLVFNDRIIGLLGKLPILGRLVT